MAQTRKIDINDPSAQGGGLAAFAPPTLEANPGDLIFWANNSRLPHWPAPSDKPEDRTKWMPYQIPGCDPDRNPPDVPATSRQVSFEAPDELPATIDYVCALHPEEKGQIHLVKAG